MEINFKTSGICCREMNFSVDENNTITDVEFVGGCNGNLSGMAKLLIGQNALEVAEKLPLYEAGYPRVTHPSATQSPNFSFRRNQNKVLRSTCMC